LNVERQKGGSMSEFNFWGQSKRFRERDNAVAGEKRFQIMLARVFADQASAEIGDDASKFEAIIIGWSHAYAYRLMKFWRAHAINN
jgi:hypothetical protein